jgi:histidinol-phosphate aminotransferase
MTRPQDIIRPDVLAMTSYPVPNSAGLVKLDAMENPYGLPDGLSAQLGERLAAVALNRYPEPRPTALLEKIKRVMRVPAGCEVLLGNGSDELIGMLSMAVARPGAKIVAPMPGFVMYALSAKLAQVEFVGVPLRADFTLDAERVIAAASKSLVVIDEAYQPFAQKSWLPRAAEFDNVVVLRTVSKLGLAGIRLGYLCGKATWLTELDKVRPPYNTNVLTQATADFLLDHLDVLDAQAAEIRAERNRLETAVAALPGATVFPSAGNFLLVRVPDAAATFETLLTSRVLIKNVSKMDPLLANCVRLTVGSAEENAQMIAALKLALP